MVFLTNLATKNISSGATMLMTNWFSVWKKLIKSSTFSAEVNDSINKLSIILLNKVIYPFLSSRWFTLEELNSKTSASYSLWCEFLSNLGAEFISDHKQDKILDTDITNYFPKSLTTTHFVFHRNKFFQSLSEH